MNVYNSSLHVLFICARVYVCVPETKQQQKSETRKKFFIIIIRNNKCDCTIGNHRYIEMNCFFFLNNMVMSIFLCVCVCFNNLDSNQ